MKKRLLSILLTLCTVMCLVPLSVSAVPVSDKTADFTASDGGAGAIALLNSTKTGAEDSTWDGETKTLVLKGINFATTATTAVILPGGTTVVLADGTESRISGGSATINSGCDYVTQFRIHGIYAKGALDIRGEEKDTGILRVASGNLTNTSDGWTYSDAIYGEGKLTVSGGNVTATGGNASSKGLVYSDGIRLSEGSALSVTGGTLTGIGGESLDIRDPDHVRQTCSWGISVSGADISVSGTGVLAAENIPEIYGSLASCGIDIDGGSLNVSDGGRVAAASGIAMDITGGFLILTDGRIDAICTRESGRGAVFVQKGMNEVGEGNIEISGGILNVAGGIFMDSSDGGKAVFSVTGGSVKTEAIFDANLLTVSDGTVESGRIDLIDFELKGGKVTVREAVWEYEFTHEVAVYSAVKCRNLTVSGGTLDAAWEWGSYTPFVFPVDRYEGYPIPLVRIYGETALLKGGTVILDTRSVGNAVIKSDTLTVSSEVYGRGYTKADGSDSYFQNDAAVPAVFTEATRINEVIITDAKTDYKPGDLPVKSAGILLPEDADKYQIVYECWEELGDGMAVAYWYSDDSFYTPEMKKITRFEDGKQYRYSVMLRAKETYVFADGCTVTVNGSVMNASDIANAKSTLNIFPAKITVKYDDADYSRVDAAITKAEALNRDEYKDLSAVDAAVKAVVRGKNITEQEAVDAMAKAIEDAIAALEKKPVNPPTGDSGRIMLLTILSAAVIMIGTAVASKKKKRKLAF